MEFSWSSVPPFKLTKQLTLKGYSIGAFKTAFTVPELDIMLDCGERTQSLPEVIFLTHLHTDHCFDSPIMLQEVGRYEQAKMIKFVMHPAAKAPFELFIKSTLNLIGNDNDDDEVPGKYEIITAPPDTQLSMNIKNKEWLIDVIKCFHTPDCVGYGFTEIRHKLKQEYEKLGSAEIIKLKNNNVSITEPRKYPAFAFLGDTKVCVFDKSPNIFNFPMIIVECNFINEEDRSLANKIKHICWHDLKPIIKAHPDNTFILIHFSRKHTVTELREFFDKEIKEGLKNIVPWLPAPKN